MTTSASTHGSPAHGSAAHGANGSSHGSSNGSHHGAPGHHGAPSQDGSANGSGSEYHSEFGEGLDPLTGSIADSVDLWPHGGGYGQPAPGYGKDGYRSGEHAPNQPFAGRPAGPARPASAASVFTSRPQSSRDRAAEQAEQARDRTGGAADTWDIREAFLNLAAGRLTDTARNDAARAHAFLTQFGFEAEDIAKLNFGLYPDPGEVEEYLKRCGFAEEAVRNSGLTRDRRGDRRTDWAGCLVLPIDDETGRCVDLAVIDPTPGPHRVMQVGLVRGADESGVVAYGLRSALQDPRGDRKGTLTLTEDLLEACLLNARGFGPVAAIGGEGGAFVARRWEELARLGIGSVTLAFREDEGRHDAVRDCLVHALRARTAPEVYVLEPTGPADCETLAETVRVHGVGAAERRMNHRTLAFHGKDFGAAPRQGGLPDWAKREPAKPAPAPQPRFNRTPPPPKRDSLGDFRERVRAELSRLPHGPERRAAAELFAEVDAALAARNFDRARDLLSRAFSFTRQDRGENGRSRYSAYGEAGTWGEGPHESREPLNDESGRSWFSAPGRTDGHARAWAFDGYRGEERDATSCNLSTVLDELCNAGRGPVICDRLHGETAAAIRPGTLTALTAADPAASLAMVCDRVADALERCDHAPLTVVLRDATPGAFAAMLIAHLTARPGFNGNRGGHGLTAGEVDARLAGRDADHHYTAKPWLADEAADRLRTHGDRLRVVDARGAAFGEVLHTLTRTGALHARGSQAEGQNRHAGGVLCDAATADELSRLAEFAAETGCWALAATAPRTPVQHTEPVWYAADARTSWQPETRRPGRPTEPIRSVEREARESARLRQFRDLVGEWIARAAA